MTSELFTDFDVAQGSDEQWRVVVRLLHTHWKCRVEDVIALLGVGRSTYYDWRRGRAVVPAWGKRLIYSLSACDSSTRAKLLAQIYRDRAQNTAEEKSAIS